MDENEEARKKVYDVLKDNTDNNQLFTNGKGDWGIYRDGSPFL